MGNLTPPGGGKGGGVPPDGIYNVPLYRYGIQAAKSGMDIEISEQLLDREVFGKFSLE